MFILGEPAINAAWLRGHRRLHGRIELVRPTSSAISWTFEPPDTSCHITGLSETASYLRSATTASCQCTVKGMAGAALRESTVLISCASACLPADGICTPWACKTVGIGQVQYLKLTRGSTFIAFFDVELGHSACRLPLQPAGTSWTSSWSPWPTNTPSPTTSMCAWLDHMPHLLNPVLPSCTLTA